MSHVSNGDRHSVETSSNFRRHCRHVVLVHDMHYGSDVVTLLIPSCHALEVVVGSYPCNQAKAMPWLLSLCTIGIVWFACTAQCNLNPTPAPPPPPPPGRARAGSHVGGGGGGAPCVHTPYVVSPCFFSMRDQKHSLRIDCMHRCRGNPTACVSFSN